MGQVDHRELRAGTGLHPVDRRPLPGHPGLGQVPVRLVEQGAVVVDEAGEPAPVEQSGLGHQVRSLVERRAHPAAHQQVQIGRTDQLLVVQSPADQPPAAIDR